MVPMMPVEANEGDIVLLQEELKPGYFYYFFIVNNSNESLFYIINLILFGRPIRDFLNIF